MNKSGYTIKETLIVIGIFSIFYLIGVISVSHAFKYDKLTEEYNSLINLMEVQAEIYAKDKDSELFKEGSEINIYANDLVKNNYFKADENGNIIDPRDTAKNLNDLKIIIIKNEDGYIAQIDA